MKFVVYRDFFQKKKAISHFNNIFAYKKNMTLSLLSALPVSNKKPLNEFSGFSFSFKKNYLSRLRLRSFSVK
ncbi:hypothetical protein FD876_11905 [Acinetobacter baumannii]|nr:hypothetical protein FD876_11905 [Acinetobacter baumannii]